MRHNLSSVAMFSASDSGGAGIAATRLREGFAQLEVRATMLVASRKEEREGVHVLSSGEGSLSRTQSTFVNIPNMQAVQSSHSRIAREYPSRDPGGEHFSGTESAYKLAAIPLAAEACVVNLHWVANFLSLEGAAAVLGDKPIFWTLHDMRPFTGGCHYSDGCTRYIDQCGVCPQLGSQDEQDLSYRAWRQQMGEYRKLNLHIVTPSRWLAECARASSLFNKFPVHVVENGHPLHVFKPLNRSLLREKLGIDPNDFVLGFSADNLQSRRKGMRYLYSCLERLGTGALRGTIRVLLLGDNAPEALFQLGLRVDAAGHVAKPEDMAVYYNVLDAVMLPSLEDNAPNVVIEAAACGTPTAAFAVGGVTDMIAHGETGWLAPAKDAGDLAKGVAFLAENAGPHMRQRCRVTALERWNAPAQAAKYKELFANALVR
ncbi:MAG: D-inositol-3-phosphate glycosyltransferase [Desulfovibrio sp.]